MFLPTAFIGDDRRSFCPKRASFSTPNSQLSTARECLTWKEVRDLHESGVQFGSHTVNHPRLVELSKPEIEIELRNSKLEIEARLGKTVKSFAYPFAFPQGNEQFLNTFEGLLDRTGYNCCVTTEIGRMKAGDDPYRLKRLPVNSCDDPPLFRSKLEGGYDWLGFPQLAAKTIKHWTGRSMKRAREVHQAEAVPN
jgi:peptidoglycan/xylan/chitin deacetylase (PgdA/CDA1 family)